MRKDLADYEIKEQSQVGDDLGSTLYMYQKLQSDFREMSEIINNQLSSFAEPFDFDQWCALQGTVKLMKPRFDEFANDFKTACRFLDIDEEQQHG